MSNIRKGLLVFLSLFIASASIAAPTVGDYNRDAVAQAVSLSSDAPHIGTCPRQTGKDVLTDCGAGEINQIGEPTNSQLARAAAEFLKPPTNTTPQVQAKSLPPVPGALFLGLAGFLCVSLVKDRRVWFAALAGLLWLGQTGFAALPELASHLRSKKQIQQSSPTLTYISELEGSFRLRSDLEGTQYIGLLRHLAGIPDATMLLPSPVNYLSLRAKRSNLIDQLPRFAISPQFSLIQTSYCSAPRTEQILPFLPALIFPRMPRGPPKLAYEQLYLTTKMY